MYVELHASSAFSFLDGASLPEALVERAASLGYPALALLDRDGVYGAPRFHLAAKRAGLKAIIGAELTIDLILRTGFGLVADRGPGRLAAYDALQPQLPHQPLNRATGHHDAFPQELPPDLAHAVDLKVLIANPADLDAQLGVSAHACRSRIRRRATSGMGMVR